MPMTFPGFTAEVSVGRLMGQYRGRATGPSSRGVSPQLPPISVGPFLDYCCCLNLDSLLAGGFPVAIATATEGRQPFAANSRFTPASFRLPPPVIFCTSCPEGDGDCACSCQDNGSPCAQRGNVTVCEP
jgi:hypothetical protein